MQIVLPLSDKVTNFGIKLEEGKKNLSLKHYFECILAYVSRSRTLDFWIVRNCSILACMRKAAGMFSCSCMHAKLRLIWNLSYEKGLMFVRYENCVADHWGVSGFRSSTFSSCDFNLVIAFRWIHLDDGWQFIEWIQNIKHNLWDWVGITAALTPRTFEMKMFCCFRPGFIQNIAFFFLASVNMDSYTAPRSKSITDASFSRQLYGVTVATAC